MEALDTHQSDTYGERIADVYDEMYPTADQSCLDLLHELAKGGLILELGIGTGRIALPLKARGANIHGIDASDAMMDRLKAKPGGSDIPLTKGDFADLPVKGSFSLIFVVFNTFFGLTTQERQLECLREVRRHLAVDGRFLIEAFVPDVARFTDGQTVRATDVRANEVALEVSRHDRATQQISSEHLVLTESGVRMYPVTIRYAWPSELDLMARLAGLALIDRWEDWKKSPFSSKSGKHISVYGPS